MLEDRVALFELEKGKEKYSTWIALLMEKYSYKITRTWYETLDHAGNIRIVAPKPVTNDKNQHIFDAGGNPQGNFRGFLEP